MKPKNTKIYIEKHLQ